MFHLDRFDGPLGLLLYLIRKEEMDIFDINIQQITEQYLESIKSLRSLDLESAGEFVAMAATLIHIKSKMLLPDYREEGEEEPQEDPRKALVQKLLEYQRFKDASARLNQLPLLDRDTWAREDKVDLSSIDEEAIEVSDRPLFSLISAYRVALSRAKTTVHKVAQALQSIASRILELRELLTVGVRREFSELVATTSQDPGVQTTSDPMIQRGRVLITFLSLLELAKLGFVSLFQTPRDGDPTDFPIYVDAKKPLGADAVVGIEDYESAGASRLSVAVSALTGAGVWDNLANPKESHQSLPEPSQTDFFFLTAEDEGADARNADAASPVAVMGEPMEVEQQLQGLFTERGEPLVVVEESASDEEIEAAERELFSETPEGEASV